MEQIFQQQIQKVNIKWEMQSSCEQVDVREKIYEILITSLLLLLHVVKTGSWLYDLNDFLR